MTQMTGAGVQMWLEENDQTTIVSERCKRRLDLGRVMRVIVVDLDPTFLAATFEPPCRATELCEHRLDLFASETGQFECSKRRGRIAAVVLTRDPERTVVRRKLLAADALRHLLEPVVEQFGNLGARAERGVMVEVDVRDHGHTWSK